ncbi:MAG: ERF family protein [Gammaproteobacteria bacterium]|nr:ERF family protein [Gammaproteobacteria bacterium]
MAKSDLQTAAESQVVPVTSQETSESMAMIAMIERAVMSPEVDIDKMERLFALKKELDSQAAEQNFNQAMAEVQAATRQVSADGENDQTRSLYATYSALDRAVRPVYTAGGFALSFSTESGPTETVRVVCLVSHRAGFSRQYHIDMPADGKGAKGGSVMTKTHATGSAVSYGMRYLLKMIFNLAVGDFQDDDGNAAGEVERVSAEQAANIRSLLEELDKDEMQFLKWVKAESVERISVSAYPNIVSELEKRRKA